MSQLSQAIRKAVTSSRHGTLIENVEKEVHKVLMDQFHAALETTPRDARPIIISMAKRLGLTPFELPKVV